MESSDRGPLCCGVVTGWIGILEIVGKDLLYVQGYDTMKWIANPLGFARVGSNPTVVELFSWSLESFYFSAIVFIHSLFLSYILLYTKMIDTLNNSIIIQL